MRWLKYFEEGLIVVLMATMTLLTFVQVLARYVFNDSFVWVMEATGVMFAWLIFIGMSYGVRVGAHIGVDALVKSLGARAARNVASVAAVVDVVAAAPDAADAVSAAVADAVLLCYCCRCCCCCCCC